LKETLSVVLPVHNAQSTLAADIGGLLDVLPELSPRFDVWIIDDGSTDATLEVAQELSRNYPQVRVLENTERKGLPEALRVGLSRTGGDYLIVHDALDRMIIDEIPKLWQRRNEGQAIVSPRRDVAKVGAPGWFSRSLPARKEGAQPQRGPLPKGSFHLLRRDNLQQLTTTAPTVAQPVPAPKAPAPVFSAAALRKDNSQRMPNTLRPNYLQKLRNFALGE